MSEQDVEAPSADDPAVADRGSLRWWKEIIAVLVFYVVYSAVRNQFGSQGTGDDVDASVAFEHARQIIDIEKAMGLYFEAHVQQWYLDLPKLGLIRFWNVFYGTAHFIVTAAAMIWAFRRTPERYPLWRNTLGATTAVAIIGFASYSLMPPRLMDDPGRFGACKLYNPEAAAAAEPGEKIVPGCDRYGYVDTLAVHGGWVSFDSEEAAAVTNQYAAMPSMHMGWSTWSALVLAPMFRRRWAKVAVWIYPVLTFFTIIVTANHFWLDAIGGFVALGFGAFVASKLTGRFGRARPKAAT